MNRIAVFPGSFDPITLGHVSIVKRAISLFDNIIIAIGVNADKNHMFSVDQRKKWIEETFKDESKVEVKTYEGLTVNFCKQVGAGFLVRGLRTSADFEFERGIGQVNRILEHDIETVFLLAEPQFTPITSSIVRDVIRNGGNISSMVPKAINLIKN